MASTNALSLPLHQLSQTCISQIEETSTSTSTSVPPTVPLCSWVLRVPMAAIVGTSLLLQVAAFSLVSLEKDNQRNPTFVQAGSNGRDFFKDNAVPLAVAHTIVTAVAALYCFLLTRTRTCLSNRRLSRAVADAKPRIGLSHARGALGLVLVLCFLLFAIKDSFIITRNSRDVEGGQGIFIVGILLALDVLLAALIALDIGLRRLHRRVLRDQAHELQEDVGDQESTTGLSLRTGQRRSEDLPKYERYDMQEPRDGNAPVYSS